MQEVDVYPRCAYCGSLVKIVYADDPCGDGVPYYITTCELCQDNLKQRFFRELGLNPRCPICDSAILITYNDGAICSNPCCSSFSMRKIRNQPIYRISHLGRALAIYNSSDDKFYYSTGKERVISSKFYICSYLYKIKDSLFERRK